MQWLGMRLGERVWTVGRVHTGLGQKHLEGEKGVNLRRTARLPGLPGWDQMIVCQTVDDRRHRRVHRRGGGTVTWARCGLSLEVHS